MGFLFDHLFKDEYFDSDTSPQRVYALILRLRKSLPKELNINVNHKNLGTQLIFNSSIQLNVETKEGIVDPDKREASRMRDHFKKNWFTTTDMANWLNKSPSTAKRAIEIAKNHYKIESQGKGRATRYRFK